MLQQFAGVLGNACTCQVVRAGADNPAHGREGGGYQAAIAQRTDTQHQVDFTEVGALQVNEAVDQA